jgi:hypothetical protein
LVGCVREVKHTTQAHKGLQDPVSVPEIAHAMLEYRPDATLVEIAESGHYPQVELSGWWRRLRAFSVKLLINVVSAVAGCSSSSYSDRALNLRRTTDRTGIHVRRYRRD